MVTIRDVSIRAGVSASTVSNVLNDRGHVAEATKDRVLNVVRELGYRANIHAQQLVTQRSRIVAIKLPELSDLGGVGIPNSTYFLNIVNGATQVANELDYALVVLPSKAKSETLRRFGLDGFIVVDPSDDDPIFSDTSPVVTIGAGQRASGMYARIDNDHAAALQMAMRELAAQGRRRQALVKDTTHRPYVESINSAYLSWAQEQGLDPNVFELRTLGTSEIDKLLGKMKAQNIDSLYASSDDIAVAMLKRAQEIGIDVPRELAIVSAVDSMALTLTSPEISAIELFPFKAGEIALKLLVDMLNGEKSPGTVERIPCTYVSRGTVERSFPAESVEPVNSD